MSFPNLPSLDLPSQWTTLSREQIYSALTRPPLVQDDISSLSSILEGHFIDLHLYDELPSTNTQLWQMLASRRETPEPGVNLRRWHGTVAIARQQSAGKGQWGRQWQSSLGGLYLSLALEPELSLQDAPHLIMSTVCGVAMAFRSCGLPIAIKWPNDLVCAVPRLSKSRLCKVGGMLTETRIHGQMLSYAVVGIGINGANPVPDPGITVRDLWAKLKGPGRVPEPLGSLSGLGAIAIYGILTGWQRLKREGIERLLENYNALLIHQDQVINLNWQGHQQAFRVQGVNEQGELRALLVEEGLSNNIRAKSKTLLRNATAELNIGTSSILPSSTEEIRFRPGTIQLGYHQPFDKTLF